MLYVIVDLLLEKRNAIDANDFLTAHEIQERIVSAGVVEIDSFDIKTQFDVKIKCFSCGNN